MTRTTDRRTPSNPLIAQLPAIGMTLGVIVSAFVAVLFTLNIGMAMMLGVGIGLSVGVVLRMAATPKSQYTDIAHMDMETAAVTERN